MSVLRYRRSSDGAWTLLDLPAGPQGAQGDKGPVGLTGAKGLTGLTGDTGPQGDRGPTGGQGPVGYDGDPTSTGNYGVSRWRIAWGTTLVTAAANAHTAWSINFGFSYVSNLNAIVTGVKNNWGGSSGTGNHQIVGAGITTVRADGLDGVVRNNGDTADTCYVAWMAWGVW